MTPKILVCYPNLPLMMSPAISVALFHAIAKEEACEFKVFETTEYSDKYSNRHIRLTELGALRKNTDDEVKDMFLIKHPDEIFPDFVKVVEEFRPDIILMPMQEDVYEMGIDLLKAIDHLNVPHIVGGTFPTAAPQIVIETPVVQRIAIHEGERTVRDIIACIRSGESLNKIRGTWYKDEDGNTVKNPPQPLCDISLITPDFTCFEDKRWERPMGGRIFKRAVSMETYRGCPYSCTYCNSPNTRDFAKLHSLGNFMRRKSADIVERDLLKYIDDHNPDFIMFQDDSFLARPKKEIFEFCDMWAKRKIPFWFNTRIENCTPDVLEALKHAGLYRMTFGIESGNEEYRRDVLKRKVTNETYLKHFEYINDSNIPYSLNVIIGMPLETRAMVMDTAQMIKVARGYDGLTISKAQFYHGTEMRTLAVKNGFLNGNHINNNGAEGMMDSWELAMPEPYLQDHDVDQLIRTFAMYAHYDHDMWPLIRKAETDNTIHAELLKRFQNEFFEELQQGGAERIETVYGGCVKHDPATTYKFEIAK
ncbi:radical SAM protein [Candidatus Babeliales bacterium]|nr:radical SAM protein [Candidatus Babeliales bacterium]